jgi:UDP-N-acetylmuramyl pentapeptide phosphotransferase/UDP-N-acetylglucosamine-1-phosphate transferase
MLHGTHIKCTTIHFQTGGGKIKIYSTKTAVVLLVSEGHKAATSGRELVMTILKRFWRYEEKKSFSGVKTRMIHRHHERKEWLESELLCMFTAPSV